MLFNSNLKLQRNLLSVNSKTKVQNLNRFSMVYCKEGVKIDKIKNSVRITSVDKIL